MAKQKIDSEKIARALRDYITTMNISQNTLSEESGVNQSQISRFASGTFKRLSKELKKLCKFAKIDPLDPLPGYANPTESAVLMEALRGAWDGTAENAESLARVIRAIGGLRRSA